VTSSRFNVFVKLAVSTTRGHPDDHGQDHDGQDDDDPGQDHEDRGGPAVGERGRSAELAPIRRKDGAI
jgi:hypothetical protein